MALDGQRGWHVRDALGESTVGPLGMLALLEMQLGLVRATPSHSERVVQMRACLAQACNGRRFYERSFAADELGTAARLLAWRDQWYEHGWDGKFPASTAGRLRDLADVEELACEQVAPGVGQRLMVVAVTLAARTPQIASVVLLDAPAEFPLGWRRVLEKLPVAFAEPAAAHATPGTVLAALQESLIASLTGQMPPPVTWRDDGSMHIVRAQTRLAAAQWLAHRIRSSCADVAVVAERDRSMLDAALDALDLPRLGLSDPSPFRPPLQLLPLALRLMWAPLDFHALLQFLSHPVQPLPAFARRRIAEKMADAPGIGGQRWEALLAEIDAHYGDEAAAVRQEIAYWIDHPRFAAADGAPLAAVYERVARLAEYFRKRLADPDETRRAGWLAGHEQTAAVLQALQGLLDQGVEATRPEALDKLVAQATSRGAANPLLHAQAGAQACVRDPAALIEPFDNVMWWYLATVPLVQSYPWSPGELSTLRQAGIDLPDTATLLARQARGWLQPILRAKQRLTLVLPREGEEAHPVWLLLAGILQGAPVAAVETTLTAAPAAGETATVAYRPLPARCRWWHLPAGVTLPWPQSMSFTSLEQLIFNPYQWVLKYPARFRPSTLLSLPNDFRLLGSLAHRVVERLYLEADSAQWSKGQVMAWFDAHLDAIVAEEGAVLLMTGKRAELESFRMRFRASLGQLHGHLRGCGLTSIAPEAALTGDTPLGHLRGSSDLLLELAAGGQAIIDMKWAGDKKYREKLARQTHLQLAIYAKLVAQERGRWPHVAYYILSKGELLTISPDVFPGVRAVPAPDGATALLWERLQETWSWRKAQIDTGAIELVFEGLAPTDDSVPPVEELPIEPLDPRYNDFIHLAGWED
ncbi:RecB family exonuclease [Cupriavidus plantarum]|uniref:RecB family exonuclease n=2 Tax=Cupriavidus plantarum TaxID=942865 RepID=A0A316EZ59_9BURK|nr:RecB family exonuclease [Cupriavidus plantarum]